MKTLYNILDEHKLIIRQLEDNEGEITSELEGSLKLTQDQFEVKAASYGYVIKHFEDDIAAIDREIERLSELKKQTLNHKDWLKSKITEAMLYLGVSQVKFNNIRLSFRKSKQVVIEDIDFIPDEYMRTIPERKEPDKTKIKKAIESGEFIVPGAKLVHKQNLQIK